MTGRVELQNKDLVQVSGGGFWNDLLDIGEEAVKVVTTGAPGMIYDAISGGGGDGGDSSGGVAAVAVGGQSPTQTTSSPQPSYNQNNSNNSGAQQNSQGKGNYNTGGMNVTH